MKGSDSVFEKTLGSDPAMVTHSAESLAVERRCERVYPPQPMFRRDSFNSGVPSAADLRVHHSQKEPKPKTTVPSQRAIRGGLRI